MNGEWVRIWNEVAMPISWHFYIIHLERLSKTMKNLSQEN